MKTVLPSFEYAEFEINYARKRIKATYPYTSPKAYDTIIFALVGFVVAPLITAVYVLLVQLLLGIDEVATPNPSPYVFLAVFLLWQIFAPRSLRIREALIKGFTMIYSRERQILVTGRIPGKHVVIRNIGNQLFTWHAKGDYARKLVRITMQCDDVTTEQGTLLPVWFPRYVWSVHVLFAEPPAGGNILITARGGSQDRLTGDGHIITEVRKQ